MLHCYLHNAYLNSLTEGFQIVFSLMNCELLLLVAIWASSWDYGTYHIGDQHPRSLARAFAVRTHIKYGSRRRFRSKIRHLAPPDGCACAFEEWVEGGRKVPKSHELAHLSMLRKWHTKDWCIRSCVCLLSLGSCNCSSPKQAGEGAGPHSKICDWKLSIEPRHEKTCLRGFRPGKTQTGLRSCRD